MIYLASDHRGMVRKEEIKKFLDEIKSEYQDVGNLSFDPNDDVIDYVVEACKKIGASSAQGSGGPKGIFFCGSGVMADVVANRFSHVRSCLAVNSDQVKAARREDNVNVLCIGGDSFGAEETGKLVGVFLETEFSGGENYRRRLEKLAALK